MYFIESEFVIEESKLRRTMDFVEKPTGFDINFFYYIELFRTAELIMAIREIKGKYWLSSSCTSSCLPF